jgi:hypothetical protein
MNNIVNTFNINKSIIDKNEINDAINDDIINDDFLNRVPNLNVSKFKKLLKEHMNGKGDHTANIWKLYTLSKWYSEFSF